MIVVALPAGRSPQRCRLEPDRGIDDQLAVRNRNLADACMAAVAARTARSAAALRVIGRSNSHHGHTRTSVSTSSAGWCWHACDVPRQASRPARDSSDIACFRVCDQSHLHSRVCATASIAQRCGKWAPGSRLRSGSVDAASQSCRCRCMSWHLPWLVECGPSPSAERSDVGSSRHSRRPQEVESAAACGS